MEIGRWWPADHTVTGRDDLTVVLEDGVGGRIFERTPDGVEHDWGEVTLWNPPDRLGYRWHLRTDRAQPVAPALQGEVALELGRSVDEVRSLIREGELQTVSCGIRPRSR